MSKYAAALGILELKMDDIEVSLKPTFKHKRAFRKIILNPAASKDKNVLFDQFSTWMVSLIKEFDPNDFNEEEVTEFVETYVMDLFNEVMVAFKYTTRAKIEEAEKKSLQDLKKTLASD